MNVLLVGSGGREHALAWALRKSPRVEKLYAAPGSAGMASLAEPAAIDPLDFPKLASFCREKSIGLAVVGPEAPLAAGIADALEAAGIRVFGPDKACARLEASKSFAKSFMERHSIPTARHAVHDDPASALKGLEDFPLPVVVKADGLAAGKGVRVCSTRREAESAVSDFMFLRVCADAGRRVVLEEFLEGREATLMAFCDGRTLRELPAGQDHKRLEDGDRGPNTGGMGVFAPTPSLTPDLLERVRREVFERVAAGLAAERLRYRGILYCGLMLTQEGPKVLEFNARFGDPETQAVLPLLETDLLDLMEACLEQRLERVRISVKKASCVCVVLASEGYPERPATGREISGLDDFPAEEGLFAFHSGTRREGGRWLTAGGRVLSVSAVCETLEAARARAYAAAARVRFEGIHMRTDIADDLKVRSSAAA